jgi:hypothetical protein
MVVPGDFYVRQMLERDRIVSLSRDSRVWRTESNAPPGHAAALHRIPEQRRRRRLRLLIPRLLLGLPGGEQQR